MHLAADGTKIRIKKNQSKTIWTKIVWKQEPEIKAKLNQAVSRSFISLHTRRRCESGNQKMILSRHRLYIERHQNWFT